MGAGHSKLGRLRVGPPDNPPLLSPSNATEPNTSNPQNLEQTAVQDDREAAALLEPVLPRLQRLRTFTVENLPPPHPLIRCKTQMELVKTGFRGIGMHIKNVTSVRSDRAVMELRLCRYIAHHYWPFPNQANAQLRVFEMYRNYLSKQLQSQLLLSPAAPVEHANSANLATDQMESRKRKLSVEHEDSEADADYENQAVSANGKRAILSKQEQETSQDSLELLAMEDAEMEYALRLSREECGLEDNTERQQLGEGSRHPDGRDEEEDIEFEKAIKASEEMYERETLARNALPVQETRPAKRRFWDMPVREKRTADGLTDEVAE